MRRVVLIVTGLACLACLGTWAWAQVPAGAPAFTKVGVVNMGAVYSQYDRVKMMKLEMEKDVEPFKQKKAKLDELIMQWKNALNNPNPKTALTPEQRETGQKVIISCSRQLEDLEIEFKKVVGKKIEDQMVMLHKEINATIQKFAQSNGYHLVLAYGEPEVKMSDLKAWERQMRVLDQGGLTVAYASPTLDISASVVQFLNMSYKGAPITPVSGTGGPPIR